MNIFIGMCGLGSRFANLGFELPKYLIVYNGAPMIHHAVETIRIPGRIHFIVKRQHLEQHKFLEKMLLGLGDEIIVSDGDTQGAAESLLLAKPYIQDQDAPMLSVNCDQYLDWNPQRLMESMKDDPYCSFIPTYKERNPKCSYVREQDGLVVEVREKKVISDDATIGYYHWAKTRDFFQDAEQMIADDHRENGEYYLAPVYNYSIQRGLKVRQWRLGEKEFWPVGTPEDLQNFRNYHPGFD
jgi:dTDP-glucose pyrophosphorylase